MIMYIFDRAVRAQKNGYFNDEMVPVRTRFTDKEGVERSITVSSVLLCHRCKHYRFRVENTAFRVPSHFSGKMSHFFAHFALTMAGIYLYYFVCFASLELKAASTLAPTWPGLKIYQVILPRAKSM